MSHLRKMMPRYGRSSLVQHSPCAFFSYVITIYLLVLCACVTQGSADSDENYLFFTHEKCQKETLSSNLYKSFYKADHFFRQDGVFELLVRFKGIADGHVILTTNETSDEPRYSISFGSYNNRFTEIRRNKPAKIEARVQTPSIMSDLQFRGFIIRFDPNFGNLTVFGEGSDTPLLQLDDSHDPLHIQYFSFATWHNRVVQVVFNCQPIDSYSMADINSNGTPDPAKRKSLIGSESNHDRLALPNFAVQKESDTSFVTVAITSLTLTHFSINEEDQTFELEAWPSFSWQDSGLKWQLDNATTNSYLHFEPDELWVPDITLYNSAQPTNLDIYGKTQCLVQHDGTVLWVPPSKFVVYCDLNLKKWPRDTQTCTVRLGSWTYPTKEVDMKFAPQDQAENVKVVAELSKEDMEWELVHKTATREVKKYECCPEDYTSISYEFTLQRRSTLYTYTVILPIICEKRPDEMRSHLLENYDTKVPPPSVKTGPIDVGINLILNYFTLEEAEHIFLANIWLSLTWVDTRLSWNRSEAKGSYVLRFASHEIWKPDITLFNNAYPTDTDHYGDTFLLVYPDGKVKWTPPARLASHCKLDLIRWPYDRHICFLKFGSWTHSGEEVDLKISTLEEGLIGNEEETIRPVDQQLFIRNSEWSLIQANVSRSEEFYACCDYPYIVATYSFELQRSSPSYIATVVIPILFVSFVNIMVFILPPNAGEKITLGCINAFILCVYLIYFQSTLPSLGDHLPLLVVMFSCKLVLVGISIVVSVFVINLSRVRKASSPPQFFRMFCNAHFAQFLGLGHINPFVSQTHTRLDDGVEMRVTYDSSGSGSGVEFDKDDQTNLVDYDGHHMANAEWILLASMIDRLTLIVYSVVCGITLALCLA